jgi:asparagine synthase (glutamine-hydrolysing)
MLRTLAHLGPEGAFSVCDGPIGLGYRSMQITREDVFDAQPLADADASALLVADVRLDNRQELASDLAIGPGALAVSPDSELLMAAWRRWGAACVEHLIGDFAFAIWDGRARRLVLGRDHMGQRHLFFHHCDRFFAFATEIKGVWAAPDVPRRISEAGFEEIFTRRWRQRVATRTKFDEIQGLRAGSILTIGSDGAVTDRRFWEPHASPEHLGQDESYYRQAYRSVLAEAVACRVRRATRPCSLLFSGGFDSASIAALAGEALGERRLVTVTSALPQQAGSSQADARSWVEVCRRGMPHLDVRYATRSQRSLFSGLERAIASNDGAVSVNTYVNDELYQTAAAAGARVVMDGHGGDYTLNPRGYFPVARLLAMGRWKEFRTEFLATARAADRPLWRSAWSDVLAAFVPARIYLIFRLLRAGEPIFMPRDPVNPALLRVLGSRGTPLNTQVPPKLIHARDNLARALRRMQNYAMLAGTLPAMHGLEFTQPFHDKRVVELALAIPEDLYFRAGRPRFLARTALADLLPQEFQTRSRRNTQRIPDLMEMAKAQEPRMLAEIDRLEKIPRLTRYFDFRRMRRMVAQRPADRRNPWAASRVRRAMRALVWALHVEWFLRDNTSTLEVAQTSEPSTRTGAASTPSTASGRPRPGSAGRSTI